MKDLYISNDIEADGPIPGEYSMLSLGAVAIDETEKIWGEFYKKLKRLPNSIQHPDTMKWWESNSDAYTEATSNPEAPKKVLSDYVSWLKEMKEKARAEEIVFLGWPIAYDYMFVYWYLVKFIKEFREMPVFKIPFSMNGVDFTSYAMGKLGLTYTDALVKNMPQDWFKEFAKKEHKAVDDARRQGKIFIKMINDKLK